METWNLDVFGLYEAEPIVDRRPMSVRFRHRAPNLLRPRWLTLSHFAHWAIVVRALAILAAAALSAPVKPEGEWRFRCFRS